MGIVRGTWSRRPPIAGVAEARPVALARPGAGDLAVAFTTSPSFLHRQIGTSVSIRATWSTSPMGRNCFRLAIFFWCASLLLPGFTVADGTDQYFGILILAIGIPLGWLSAAWPVYANIFFLYAARALYRNKQPKISIFAMLLIAATLPFFDGVLRDEGTSVKLPVSSWGWGAVLWLAAICLLSVAAAIANGWIKRYAARFFCFALALVSFSVVFLSAWQRIVATEADRARYLSPAMAFTVQELCPVDIASPKIKGYPPETIVDLKIDPSLLTPSEGIPSLSIPALKHYQIGHEAWISYGGDGTSLPGIKVRVPAVIGGPVLKGSRTPSGAVLQVLESADGRVIHQQDFAIIGHSKNHPIYCPYATNRNGSQNAIAYDQLMMEFLGQRVAKPSRPKLAEELASEPCPVGRERVGGIHEIRHWDGRDVVVSAPMQQMQGICSKSYAALIEVLKCTDPKQDPPDYIAVFVFDRHNLRPLTQFISNTTCDSRYLRRENEDVIKELSVSNEEAILTTVANRRSARRFP